MTLKEEYPKLHAILEGHFQTAVRGFESVGWKRSTGQNAKGDTVCLYRGPDGCRCFVGWLIPEEQYKPEMEGYSVFGLMSLMDMPFLSGIEDEVELECGRRILNWMQINHDCAADGEPLKAAMRKVRDHYDFAWPEEVAS